MKNFILTLSFAFVLGACSSKSHPDKSQTIYDAKKIIGRYQLTKVDSLRRCEDCKGTIWSNKGFGTAPTLLVVTALNGDTIFTHIGEKWHLNNYMFFKRDGNYFAMSSGSYNEKFEIFNSYMVMRLNPESAALEKVNELDLSVFTQYLAKRIDTSKIETWAVKWRYDTPTRQILLKYIATKDTLDGNIDYCVESPMLLEKTGNSYTIVAKPTRLYREQPDNNDDSRRLITRNHPIGQIKGIPISFDCINCRQAYTEAIEIFAEVAGKKVSLLRQDFGDMFFAGAELFSKDGGDFLYINSGHTYGHEQGFLYSIDIERQIAHKVNVIESKSTELPQGYSPYKSFDLQRDENGNFYESLSLRNDEGNFSSITTHYRLLKVKPHVYMLEPVK